MNVDTGFFTDAAVLTELSFNVLYFDFKLITVATILPSSAPRQLNATLTTNNST